MRSDRKNILTFNPGAAGECDQAGVSAEGERVSDAL